MRLRVPGKLHLRSSRLSFKAGRVLREESDHLRPRVRRIERRGRDVNSSGERRGGFFSRRRLFRGYHALGFSAESAREEGESEGVLQRVDYERVRGVWITAV